MKKLLAFLLSVCVLASMVPMTAFADNNSNSGDNIVQISKKEYAITPGVTEYELITNTSDLSSQQVGHIMEINPDSSSEIRVGYNDYQINTIASGNNWAMRKPTEQAEAAEKVAGVDVVCAVNGDFFNMSNGYPVGYTVMQGTVINNVDSSCFWIDDKGKAHVASNRLEVNAYCNSNGVKVKEAVGGGDILLRNGEKTAGGKDYNGTVNPRTCVGIKGDGTVIIYMVDGRQAPYSVGMNQENLADMMLHLGCVDAINLDGGGSSTFATQREGETGSGKAAGLTMRCRPSDGYERAVATSLLVISTAASDGVFDHASITPNQEIYTPGSSVQFSAVGIDKAGKGAPLPSGLTWEVISGGGTIDSNGTYSGNNSEGTVKIALKNGGTTVGTAEVEFRWPDKLGFTNSSVSLDFGQTSDLSFHPTYKGRQVHYKNGDFTWSVDESKGYTYKYSLPVETVTKPGWGGYTSQLMLALTGNIESTQEASFDYGNYRVYNSKYKETSKSVLTRDGTIEATESITHMGATMWSYATGKQVLDNITGDVAADTTKQICGVAGLQNTRTASFTLGSFSDNKFTADQNNSFNGTIKVTLANNGGITGSIDVIVGMDPQILMDFEGHTDPRTNQQLSAEKYWTTYVGNSKDNGTNQLSLNEQKAYRLFVRDTTNKGVVFPTKADGSQMNGIVSFSEDSDVRFGNYAFRLAWDFSKVAKSNVGAADFGFSSMVYSHAVQPTKIGFWVNVPSSLSEDESQLKMIFVGGIDGISSDNKYADKAYWDMDASGNLTWHEGMLPHGTTQYLSYHSYDSEGNISGSELKDWAGKGWTWVEADLSGAQFPIGIQLGYTIRVVSPQNYTKGSGSILIDNLQLIYGTNTNDTNNPVIESVMETGTNTELQKDVTTSLTSGDISIEATYNDSQSTDKYASGIDVSGVQIAVDGKDYTSKATIETGHLLLPGLNLNNGTHNVTITVKDLYGNVTKETRSIEIKDNEGGEAEVSVESNETELKLGSTYTLNILNKGENPTSAAYVEFDLPEKYLDRASVTAGTGYTVSTVKDSKLKITINRNDSEDVKGDGLLASVSLSAPDDVQEGDVLRYSVPAGYYYSNKEIETFSIPETSVGLSAAYTIKAGQAIKGVPAKLKVTNAEGKAAAGIKVYKGANIIGTTDQEGILSYTFDSEGRHTVYAKDEKGGRSWNIAIIVSSTSVSGIGDGSPFGVQNVAVQDADRNAAITWLASIDQSKEGAYIRYSTDKNSVESTESKEASGSIMTFEQSTSGEAVRLNTAKISGLTPDTTYYYQVGDGEKWSDIYSFKTAPEDKEADTNFVVLGDVQTTRTENLTAALRKIDASPYDFGIQTGDAIDNVTVFNNWRALFNVINAGTLKMPLIHTMGNHEYYGDSDGSVSGGIFSLPEKKQGSYYSVEYGSVYVGVINNGGDLSSALAAMKKDAEKSNCEWKVLVLHEPIYGTTSERDASARKEIASAIQDAGIEFVFSGDDHSYARTYPMKDDAKLDEDSKDGVVYFVSGDLSSKDNEFHSYDYFVRAIKHNDYSGCYLSVKATKSSFTVRAVDCNGNELDSYTKTRTECQQGKHTFNENSEYNLTNDSVTCALCGKEVNASDTGYTGKLKVSGDNTRQVMLSKGKLLKNEWFPYGTEICHAGPDGILHETVTTDTATCTKNGHITAKCKTCNQTYTGAATWAKGHSWDANHVCTVCGTKGIDISQADLKVQYAYYSYTGSDIRPKTTATYNGKTLNAKSDRTGTDAYISYKNNTNVGVAAVTYEGRGDYYGSVTASYTIVPANVKTIKASETGKDYVTLSWDAAKGADTYIIQEKNGYGWTKVGETGDTSYKVTGLDTEKNYVFRVNSRATVEGKNYYCIAYSNNLSVDTTADPEKTSSTFLKGYSCTVNGQTFKPQTTDSGEVIFLPSSANLSALEMNFTVEGTTDKISLSGNAGSKELEAYSGTVDVSQVASKEEDGTYKIEAKIGDRSPVTIRLMKSECISAMYITSSNPSSEGREYVEAGKQNTTTASMKLVSSEGTERYSGELKQLKARGNSTMTYPKKSYQIKLDSRGDLLGSGEKVKTWVLLANYADATQMHDKLFKDLSADLGMDYTASCDWVDLYYDGEYRGTYLLSEKNSLNNTSVNITDMEEAYQEKDTNYGKEQVTEGTNSYGNKILYTSNLPVLDDLTGGYLIELNKDQIDEPNGFRTSQNVSFNVKSPQYASEDALKYISEYYQEFENAVYATDANGNYTGYNETTQKYYYDYCDIDSLVKMYLVQQLSGNADAFASSLFFYKDKGGKLYAGPIWDMDITCGTGWDEEIGSDRDFLEYRYLSKALQQIPSFQDAVKKYFNEEFLSKANALIGNGGKIAGYESEVAGSAKMNDMLWPMMKMGSTTASGNTWESGTSYEDVVSGLTKWLQARINFMKKEYSGSSSGGSGSSSGGGGGAPAPATYTNNVSTVDNGTVAVSSNSPKAGDIVTLTVTPNEGYSVDSVAVTDANGNMVSVTPNADGTYSFTQPAGAVTISAVMKAKEEPTPGAETSGFVDVPDRGDLQTAVNYGVKKGYIKGTSETTYSPNAEVTRAQFVTFIYRIAGSPDVEGVSGFADVDGQDVGGGDFNAAIKWAADNGIARGIGEGVFAPKATVTREEAVAFLHRYYTKIQSTANNTFKDVQSGAWYEEDINWGVGAGVINGYNADTFGVGDFCTRGQTAQLFYRVDTK